MKKPLRTNVRKGAAFAGPLMLALMGSTAHATIFPIQMPGASSFTTGYRYDAMQRLTGTISPDPDGSGPRGYPAVRNTYDGDGNLVKVERGELSAWRSETVAPSAWTGFTVLQTVDAAFDLMGRKARESLSSGGTVYTLTQTSYDSVGRVDCVAVRMDPASFASPPASACTAGAPGSYGPDRIVQNGYDARGQLVKVTEGVGTSSPRDAKSLSYTLNGKLASLTDAEYNTSTFEYDGFDRLSKLRFPVAAKGAQASSTTDYEQYGYDPNGNRTSLRNRAGEVIAYGYDPLNRMSLKDRPGTEPDVSYAYDNRGLMTSASFASTGEAVTNVYDNVGRLSSSTSSMNGVSRTVSGQYDRDGGRTQLTYPDGFYVTYDRDNLGRVTAIRENGATSGVGVLASYVYDGLGRRTSLTRGNGTVTSYGYDGASRLTSLGIDLGGTASDQNVTLAYNPASQIVSRTGSNDTYAFTGLAAGNRSYQVNGLNQYVSVGGASASWDAKGNMTSDPDTGYGLGYSSENLLTTVNGGAWTGTLRYDPSMRLYDSGVNSRTAIAYDGDTRIAEYNTSNAQTARFVHGPGTDEPLVEYTGVGLATRTFVHADERGSIVAASNDSGAMTLIGRFDEYGKPQSFASYRFGFTGAPYETMSDLYYLRARFYNYRTGTFVQTDPIGYQDQVNLYAYVRNDPVNRTDPSGQDSMTCRVVDGEATGCVLTPDNNDTTTVTIEETRHHTDVDGRQYETHTSSSQIYQGSISQENWFSKRLFGVGDQILRSISQNLSTITGTELTLRLPAEGSGSNFGSADALGAIGGGRQFNGRPGPNQVQNRQVNDAARELGLNAEQRRQLGRAVEEESRQGGANLGYHDIRAIAEAIKSGRY